MDILQTPSFIDHHKWKRLNISVCALPSLPVIIIIDISQPLESKRSFYFCDKVMRPRSINLPLCHLLCFKIILPMDHRTRCFLGLSTVHSAFPINTCVWGIESAQVKVFYIPAAALCYVFLDHLGNLGIFSSHFEQPEGMKKRLVWW
jgi:hypothetical protein